MYEYKVCIYLEFFSGADPDSFYPGKDKLWLEILLDEYRNGDFKETIDCNGISLPLTFLHLGKEARGDFIKLLEDEIAENIAVMLVRNNINEYDFDGPIDIDWLNIANAEAIEFDNPELDKRLERLRW